MWPWAPPSGPSAGMSSPGALARLEALRSECEWKPLPSSLLRTSFVRSIDGPGLPQRQEQLRAASACVRNASGPDGEAYFIFNRLGAADGSPIAMPPGGWRAWDVRGGFPYIPLLDCRLRAAVVNRTIDVTTTFVWPIHASNASPIALPPLHNHHAIVSSQRPPPDLHFLNGWRPYVDAKLPTSVADFWCAGGHGAECLVKELPLGTAWALAQSEGQDTSIVINDVRARGAPLPLWYEVAYRVLLPGGARRRRVRRAVGLEFFLPTSQHEQIAGASLGSRIEGGMFQTFALPEGRPSLHFLEVRWPRGGEVVGSLLHAHHEWLDESWLIRGALRPALVAQLETTLGADAARALAQRYGKTPWALPLAENPSALPTLDAAKQAVHRVLAEDPSRRVLCRFRGARESAVDAELANGSARFDRAANLAAGRCDGIRFAEGEAWTSVAFNTAPAAAGRQHSTWVAAVAFDA